MPRSVDKEYIVCLVATLREHCTGEGSVVGAGVLGVRWRGWEDPEVGARGHLGWAFGAACAQRWGAGDGGGKSGVKGGQDPPARV